MIRKLLLLLILPVFVMGQSHPEFLGAGLDKEVEVGAFLSTSGQNPFWLRSNQYGIVPLESQGITVRARIGTEQSFLNPSNRFTKKDSIDRSLNWKGFTFDYALEAVANVGKVNQFIVPEAYAAVKWKAFELYAGRRREIVGLVDTTLTSGSYIWSGNALPMPKVQLSIPEYTPILGKGLVSIKGAYAHGWFDNKGRVKSFNLHQKWLYGRLGRENSKWKFYGGFNHQVQWGGYNQERNTDFADNFYAYLYSVIPLKSVGARASEFLTQGDKENRVGNQLGTIDIAVERSFKNGNLLFYRQSLYEQGAALLRLANIKDGLNGLRMTLTPQVDKVISFNHFNLEYLYTNNQGTSPILFTKEIGWELENYFTHYQYIDGWTYNKSVIGTPFITTEEATEVDFPNGNQLINNNRTAALHLAASIRIMNTYDVLLRVSHSSNNGILINRSPILPVDQKYKQTSFLLMGSTSLTANSSITANLGLDMGEMFKNGLGLTISYRRTY
jgi:hypothetical protein